MRPSSCLILFLAITLSLSAARSETYILMIAADTKQNDSSFHLVTEWVMSELKGISNVKKKNIFLFTGDNLRDAPSEVAGVPVRYAASKSKIEETLSELAKKLSKDDDLIVFINAHGEKGGNMEIVDEYPSRDPYPQFQLEQEQYLKQVSWKELFEEFGQGHINKRELMYLEECKRKLEMEEEVAGEEEEEASMAVIPDKSNFFPVSYSYATLGTFLGRIPANKYVFVEACYSGTAVEAIKIPNTIVFSSTTATEKCHITIREKYGKISLGYAYLQGIATGLASGEDIFKVHRSALVEAKLNHQIVVHEGADSLTQATKKIAKAPGELNEDERQRLKFLLSSMKKRPLGAQPDSF